MYQYVVNVLNCTLWYSPLLHIQQSATVSERILSVLASLTVAGTG